MWLAPLAAATGVAIATDHYTMSSVVSQNPSFNSDNVNVSNVLIGGFIAAPVALFGVGQWEHDAKARETGCWAARRCWTRLVVEQGMKLVFWRERPSLHNSRGLFWQGDAGWELIVSVVACDAGVVVCCVIAGEYRSPWVQATVYTLATGVSLTRVLGQDIFRQMCWWAARRVG